MRPLVLVFAILAVAAIAAVAWWGGDRAPTGAEAGATRAAATAGREEPTPGVAGPTAGPPSHVERDRVRTDAADADAAAAARGDVLLVRVVDATTELPVAGAAVRTLGEAALPVPRERFLADPERWLIDAPAAVTDAAGTARLPRPAADADVARTVFIAREGDRYGAARLGPRDAAELRILLRPDRSARVLVLDDHGRPAAGVRVAHRRMVVVGLAHGEQRIAHTGDDGIAHLAHLQEWPAGEGEVSEVSIREPGVAVEQVPLDCEAPPREPIVLELPATGRIVVRHVDGDGLAGSGGEITLAEPGRQTFGSSSFQEPLTDGSAEFAWVGLGAAFEVTRQVHIASQGPLALRGPVRAGETVELLLPEWRPTMVRARLFDEAGAALTSVLLELELRLADSAGMKRTAMTGHDGGVFVPLDGTAAGGVLRSVELRTRAPTREGLSAVVDVDDRPLEGLVDLGDVVMRLPPWWAAGRAVDQAGAPVDLESGQLECLAARDGASPPSFHAGTDGGFELRGGDGVERVRVVAARGPAVEGAVLREPVEIARGARDVRLVLERRASLTVGVAGSSDRAALVDVVLWSAAGGEPIRPGPIPRVRGGATEWTFTPEPGRYRVTVGLVGESEPRVVIEDVELRPGANRDPRLTGIVVPDARRLRVELVGADGRLLETVRDGFAFVQADGVWHGRFFFGSSVDLLVPAEPVDLIVAATGFHPVRRARVVGDLSTTLEPLPSVPIEVVVTGGEVPAGARFTLQAQPRSPTERIVVAGFAAAGAAPWIGSVTLVAGAGADLPVGAAGEYELSVELRLGMAPQRSVVDFEPRTFVVPAAGGAAPLVVRVPAAALRR